MKMKQFRIYVLPENNSSGFQILPEGYSNLKNISSDIILLCGKVTDILAELHPCKTCSYIMNSEHKAVICCSITDSQSFR